MPWIESVSYSVAQPLGNGFDAPFKAVEPSGTTVVVRTTTPVTATVTVEVEQCSGIV